MGNVEELEKFGPSRPEDTSWQDEIDAKRADDYERENQTGIYHPLWNGYGMD
jgi:hypothetical protein